MPPDIEDDLIEIPSDLIALGEGPHDADGLSKTGDVPPAEAPEVQPKTTPKVDPGLEVAQRRLQEAQERIAAMSKAVDDEKVGRQKAEKDALEANTQAWRSGWAKLHADRDVIHSGFNEATTAQASARRELLAAKEAGDAAREIAATEALTVATSSLQEYQRGKSGIDAEIARYKDPYERFEAAVSERERAPAPKEDEPKPDKTAKQLSPDEWVDTQAPAAIRGWLKDNRDFMPGGKRIRSLNRFVDGWLEQNGDDRASLDTKAFAAALESEFSTQEPTYVAEEEDAPEAAPKAIPKPKAKLTAAAPVSRGDALYSSRNPNAKAGKLPPKLAAFVKASGLDPTQYFHGAVADIKAGKLPKEFLDPDYPHDF